MVTVYVDVLFVVNFLINILIVESTGLIINEKTNWKKSLLSAFAGALYAVVVFFSDMKFVHSIIMKLLLSGAMVKIAFKTREWRHFLKMCGCFYLVSFIFGGSITAVLSMTDLGGRMGAIYSNGSIYFNLPWQMLFASGAATYCMISVFSHVRKKKISKESLSRRLSIHINGKSIETKAIIDTGNSLFDPITGSPVIVCEYEELKGIIPMTKGESLIEKMQEAGLRIRMIPFSSIGKEKGIMPGFLPDRVKIDESEARGCVVGISETRLSHSEDYHALLNPMITVKKGKEG